MFRSLQPSLLSLLLLAIAVFSTSHGFAESASDSGILFSAKEKTWIKENPEVSIAFVREVPPAVIRKKDGSYTGILTDYVKLLEEKTGIHFTIKTWPSWEETLTAGRQREVDIIGPVTAQPAHTEHYLFSLPLFLTPTYIFGPTQNYIPGNNLKGLKGKTVGYIQSSLYIENFAKTQPDIEFVPYKTPSELLKAQSNGEIEFFIHSRWFEFFLKTHGYTNFKRRFSIRQLRLNTFFGVRNDQPELNTIIDKVLATHQQDLVAINWKWAGISKMRKPSPAPLQLTEKEHDWLADHASIKVGIHTESPPIEFTSSEGEYSGIAAEYLKRIEENLGIRFTPVTASKGPGGFQQLLNQEVDLILASSPTTQQRQQASFTAPYLSTPAGIFSSADRVYFSGLDALRDKTIVAVKGDSVHEWLLKTYPELKVITAPTLKEAMRVVTKGEAYAFIGNLITTSHYVGTAGLKQIRVIGETEYKYELSMAVRKDWGPFNGILQKAIEAIPEKEKKDIFNDWISVEYKHSVDYSLLLRWLGAASALLLIFGYWNRKLHTENRKRRQAEEALTKAKLEAEQSSLEAQQAAEVKSQFLANMSHEIRTPINTVINAGNLLHQSHLSHPQQEYLNMISHSADALLGTIDDILDFSKGEAGKREIEVSIFEIDDVLFRTKQIFSLAAENKDLLLTFHVSRQIPKTLKGDSEKLGQILRNLISNAIKFTDEGQVDIRVELAELDKPAQQAVLTFKVHDTGIGISPETKNRLFKPFTQADNSIAKHYGGTGLGLSISRQLADLMGGQITLESAPGEGSTFTLELPFEVVNDVPRSTERAVLTMPENPPPIHAIPQLENTTVLLAEDHELNQFLGRSLLELLGTTVHVAANGLEVLKVLETEEIDLIFMDILMPEMNGHEATRAIRQLDKWKNLPIIGLSAHAMQEERDKSLEAGMDDYLSKPFKPEQLKEKLLQWTQPQAE